MGYDHWKATEPEPFEDFPPDDDMGECDCCGERRELSLTIFLGIETFACEECLTGRR